MPWFYWLIGVGCFYVAVAVLLLLLQHRLLYPRSLTLPDLAEVEGRLPDVVQVKGEAGPLNAWHWPARSDKPTLLYFQGNAGHIGHRANKLLALREEGFGLLLAGYRGYGGNPGRPSEEGLIADGRAQLEWLLTNGHSVVLYGESLGSGVAVALAADPRVKASILEAPFDSVAAIAQRRYPIFPAARLLREKWDSKAWTSTLRGPVLWIHGTADRVVPKRHGERLFASLPAPKTQVILDGAGHGDLWEYPACEAGVRRFLASVA